MFIPGWMVFLQFPKSFDIIGSWKQAGLESLLVVVEQICKKYMWQQHALKHRFLKAIKGDVTIMKLRNCQVFADNCHKFLVHLLFELATTSQI